MYVMAAITRVVAMTISNRFTQRLPFFSPATSTLSCGTSVLRCAQNAEVKG